MSNDYYTPSGSPSTGATGSSATMRAEFVSLQSGFDKLPPLNAHGNEFVRINAGGTGLESRTNNQVRSDLGLVPGTNVQAWDADLDALAALDATVGILIKTAAATYARRNLVGTANEITVTNGNGVAGNITVSLPTALTFTGKTVTGGTFNNVSITNSGFGTMSTQDGNNVSITGGSISGVGNLNVNNLVATGSITGNSIAGNVVATQANMEAASSTSLVVTPGRQQFHPSAAKGWCEATTSGSAAASYNVTSVTDGGTGLVAINWTTAFSSAAYCAVGCLKIDQGGSTATTYTACVDNTAFGTTSAHMTASRVSDGALIDPNHFMIAAFGDQ